MQSWFVIDLLSSIPFQILASVGAIPEVDLNNGYLKILKLPKYVKIVR